MKVSDLKRKEGKREKGVCTERHETQKGAGVMKLWTRWRGAGKKAKKKGGGGRRRGQRLIKGVGTRSTGGGVSYDNRGCVQ